MVGAKEDLPLTTRGIEQARSVGAALAANSMTPTRIISGPLQRTRVFAEYARSEAKASAEVEIDDRLVEFDYGAWSGLSHEEIEALSGHEALHAWQERGERPRDVTFVPSVDQARADAIAFMGELLEFSGCCLVVTSNGRLREFGQLLFPASLSNSFKVKTGHSCLIAREGSEWKVLGWDLDPEKLKRAIVRLS